MVEPMILILILRNIPRAFLLHLTTTLVITAIVSKHGTASYELAHADLSFYAASKGDVPLLMIIVLLALHALIQWISDIAFVTVSSS